MTRPIPIHHLASITAAALALTLAACATPATHHPVVASDLGVPSRTSSMSASLDRPGTVMFRRVAFAHWSGGRGTFIDRDDPRTAAVPKGNEAATIYAYFLDHPRFGRVMIDSGVSAGLRRG